MHMWKCIHYCQKIASMWSDTSQGELQGWNNSPEPIYLPGNYQVDFNKTRIVFV